MNPKLKYLSTGTILGATLIAIVFLTVFAPLQNRPAVFVTVFEENKPSGHVSVQIWRNGELIYSYETDNIIVTIGSTWVKDFLRQGTTGATNATDDIAIGTHGTPVVGDTELQSEQTDSSLQRTSGTVANINATAYNVTKTWTSSISATINATSLHRSPTPNSNNNAVAIASISSVSLLANDQLQVTWKLNVPSG